MNKNKTNQHHSIDDTAKKLFQNFQMPPPSNTWEDLHAVDPEHDIDHLFQKQFKYLEVTPSDHNWKAISKRVAFPSVILRLWPILHRAAAVFIISFSIYVLHDFLPHDVHQQDISSHSSAQKSITLGEVVEKNKALKNNNPPFLMATDQETSKEEQQREVAKMLLASLLEENDFPDSLLDLEDLEAILQPLEPLPVFSAMASNAENETILAEILSVKRVKQLPKLPTIDLTISIPLRVVEEDEIEDLLRMYERFEKKQLKNNKK